MTFWENSDIIDIPLVGGLFCVHIFWDAHTPFVIEGGIKRVYPEFLLGGADMRVKITLACSECKQRNYDTKKNKKNDPDRLEMNKYCRFCRKHTLHKETK